MNLTLSDNANNTGFTVAISGSSGGTVSVWYTPADRPWPGDAWILGGSRVGNGTLVVAAPARFYFVYAVEGSVVTPPERVAVTTGQHEPATILQSALVSFLKIINLPNQTEYDGGSRMGTGGWTVLGQLESDPSERSYPCLVASYDSTQERLERGTNGTDDVVYPFRLALYDAAVTSLRQWHSPWVQFCRSRISKSIRNVHALGVPSLVVARVTYGTPSQRKIQADGAGVWQGFAGSMTVELVNREPRGLGS